MRLLPSWHRAELLMLQPLSSRCSLNVGALQAVLHLLSNLETYACSWISYTYIYTLKSRLGDCIQSRGRFFRLSCFCTALRPLPPHG